MANFCIPKNVANTLKTSLQEGKIKPEQVISPDEFSKLISKEKVTSQLSNEQIKEVAGMYDKIESAKSKMNEDYTFKSEQDRLEYGHSLMEYGDYISNLKNESKKVSLTKEPAKFVGKFIKGVADVSKSIVASMDNSAIFTQGWKTLLTNPGVWAKNALESFGDIASSLGGKEVVKATMADIHSRPNAISGTYDSMKLALGNIEEAFPTSLPEKIPFIGKLYKASEEAYTSFVYKTRADVADKMIDVAKKTGVNLDDKFEAESIGKLVNSLTGRGYLGKLEPVADVVNSAFFSARNLKSNIDTLTFHAFDKISPFARKQAAINLVKIVGGTAGVLAIADALIPGSVETDPRSSDFGKIKVGNTRFDVSGGMSSIVTLASRVMSQSTKSSTTGKITKLGTGEFGSQTAWDVLMDFGTGKASPAASVVIDMLKNEDYYGNKPTVAGEFMKSVTPLSTSAYMEMKKDPEGANALLGTILDGLGISTSTYGGIDETVKSKLDIQDPEVLKEFNRLNKKGYKPTVSDIESSTKVKDLKIQVSNETYQGFVNNFNSQYPQAVKDVISSDEYKSSTIDKKKSMIDSVKTDIEKSLLNGLDYTKTEKPSVTDL